MTSKFDIPSVPMNVREQFIYDVFNHARKSVRELTNDDNFDHYTHIDFGQGVQAQMHIYLEGCIVGGRGWHALIAKNGIKQKQIMIGGVPKGKPMNVIKERAVLYITDEDAFTRDFTYLHIIGAGAYNTAKKSPDSIFDFLTK